MSDSNTTMEPISENHILSPTPLPAATILSRVKSALTNTTNQLTEIRKTAKDQNYEFPQDLVDKEQAYRDMLTAIFTAKFEESLQNVETIPDAQVRTALRKEIKNAKKNTLKQVEEADQLPEPISTENAKKWLTREHTDPELVEKVQSLSVNCYKLVEMGKLLKCPNIDTAEVLEIVEIIEDVYENTSLGQWAEVMRDYLEKEKENRNTTNL